MDIGVIGGGITGLGIAALLAGDHRVVLWESSPRIGGVAAIASLDGLMFCPGPQFFWGFGEDGEGSRILRRMGLAVPMRQMPTAFDQLSIGDGPFRDVIDGSSVDSIDEIVRNDPTQAGPMRRFIDALDHIGAACVAISRGARFMDSGAAMLHRVMTCRDVSARARGLVLRHHRASVAGYARSVGLGMEALRVLAYHQGIFAERLEDLSLILFAAARHHFKRPLYVPEEGTRQLPASLASHVRARGGHIVTSAEVVAVERDKDRWLVRRLGSDGVALAPTHVDRVVFACAPPVAARLLPEVTVQGEPSHCVTALCLSVDVDPGVRQALRQRNFTWYRTATDDVSFHLSSTQVDYVNFTSPTLNTDENGSDSSGSGPCIVVAFYPGGADAETMAVEVEAVVTSMLSRWGTVRVRARRVIGRRQWQNEFGSHAGAIYGRRMTPSSIQRKATNRLPQGISVAHSSAGISGIIGCLEMAERIAEEINGEVRGSHARAARQLAAEPA